jgi:hypothetical protein
MNYRNERAGALFTMNDEFSGEFQILIPQQVRSGSLHCGLNVLSAQRAQTFIPQNIFAVGIDRADMQHSADSVLHLYCSDRRCCGSFTY